MKRVLIVEDSELQQKLLLEALKDQGYEVDIEANGSRAIYAANDAAYDLILLDIHMPRTNGLMVLAELREAKASKGAHVIIITSDKRPEVASLAMRFGASEYITKPVDVRELREKASFWISQPPKERGDSLSAMGFKGIGGRKGKEGYEYAGMASVNDLLEATRKMDKISESKAKENETKGNKVKENAVKESEAHADKAVEDKAREDKGRGNETRESNGILIVEDSEVHQEILVSILKKNGYKTHAVNNGAEAIMFAKKNKYDLILLDISMPKVGGLEVLSEISKEGASIATNVIMVTVDNRREIMKKAILLGACDYLLKPINAEKLLEKIDKWNVREPGKTGESPEPSKEQKTHDKSAPAEPSTKDEDTYGSRVKIIGAPEDGDSKKAGGKVARNYSEDEKKKPAKEAAFKYDDADKKSKKKKAGQKSRKRWQMGGDTEKDIRILIVEDSHIQQAAIVGCLKDKNYKIDKANNGRKALNLITWTAYDLVLLDIHMPYMDGLELLEQVGHNLKKDGTKVIIITNDSGYETVTKAAKLGACDFIIKPFSANQLLEKIGKWLK